MDIALDRVQLAYVGGRSVRAYVGGRSGPGNRQHDQEQLWPQRGNGLDLSVQPTSRGRHRARAPRKSSTFEPKMPYPHGACVQSELVHFL